VAGSCEYGDEPSGSGATELVRITVTIRVLHGLLEHGDRGLNICSVSGSTPVFSCVVLSCSVYRRDLH
jgi:hypothetical protein